MSYFTTTLFNLLILMALVIPGFLLKKAKLVSDNAVKDLSGILLYVGMPFLIFSTMLQADIYSVSWVNILLCVALSIVVHLVGVGLGWLVNIKDKDKARKAVCIFSSTFSNCGFLGIPLTYVIVPAEFLSEALLYAALYNVVFNFLTWMVGSLLLADKAKASKKSMIKAVLNPCTVGFLLSLPFVLTGVNLIEVEYVGSFIKHLSGLCVPVSMLVLGFRVANIKFPNILKSKYVYKNAFVRLIAVPLITFALAVLLMLIPGVDTAFTTGIVVVASMPTAASAIAFAEKFEADSLLTSELVITSTVISIITVPLMLLLVSLVI